MNLFLVRSHRLKKELATEFTERAEEEWRLIKSKLALPFLLASPSYPLPSL